MTTIGTPRIEHRPRRVYMGIRFIAPFTGMSKEISKHSKVVDAWLNERSVETSGPPFLRYHVIDMRGFMDLSYCVPVSSPLPEGGSIKPGETVSFDLAEMSSITAKATRDTFCDCCLFASSK